MFRAQGNPIKLACAANAHTHTPTAAKLTLMDKVVSMSTNAQRPTEQMKIMMMENDSEFSLCVLGQLFRALHCKLFSNAICSLPMGHAHTHSEQ